MCHRHSRTRHDIDTETEGRQNARQDERQCFCLTPKEMMKPPKLCPTKKFACSIQDCILWSQRQREPPNQTSLALGSWDCGFLQERAQEQTMSKQNLLGILAHLHRWASVWLTLTRTKIEKSKDDGHRSFRAVPELCAAQKPDP